MKVPFDTLHKICLVGIDRFPSTALTRVLTFKFGDAITTIQVVFDDEQSGADMAINFMTTLPDSEKNKGHGSTAVKNLLDWARQSGLNNIQAVQVGPRSENFWTKNGFEKLNNITNDFKLVC